MYFFVFVCVSLFESLFFILISCNSLSLPFCHLPPPAFIAAEIFFFLVNVFLCSKADPAWALFESAARMDDDGDIVTGKGASRASRQHRDEHFPEKIIVSGAGLCNTSQTLSLDT